MQRKAGWDIVKNTKRGWIDQGAIDAIGFGEGCDKTGWIGSETKGG